MVCYDDSKLALSKPFPLFQLQYDLSVAIIGCSYVSGIATYTLGTILVGTLTDRLVRGFCSFVSLLYVNGPL